MKSAHAAPGFEGGDHLPLRASPIVGPEILLVTAVAQNSDRLILGCHCRLVQQCDLFRTELLALAINGEAVLRKRLDSGPDQLLADALS